MIVLEGGRHNFLPRDILSVSEWSGLAAIPAWLDNSELGTPALELSIPPQTDFSFASRIPLDPTHRDYTLSVHAWTPQGAGHNLGIRVTDSHETQIAYSELTARPVRIVRAARFAQTPAVIETAFFGRNLSERPLIVRLGMPMLEEGLFSTSPIGLGEYRAEDQLSYTRAGNFFDGPMGTIAFLFVPAWSAHELSYGFSPHLISCSNQSGSEAIDIYADADNSGCIAVRLATGGHEHFIRSDVFPQRDKIYSIALTWAPPYVALIVNGFRVGEIEAAIPLRDTLGSNVFLGKSARSEFLSAFGCFEQLAAWAFPLTDYQIRAVAYASAPNQFPHFRFAHLHESYDCSAWPALFANYLLKYPNKFQQSPPRWANNLNDLTEGDFRDDFCRSVGALQDVNVIPEEHANAGRTDALFSCFEGGAEKRIRVEYKIWGRHDYNEVPTKPLKYFRAGDRRGAVFMINANKRKGIGEEYRQIVDSYPEGCIGIIDLPFGDSFADHFVSVHELPWGQVEVLHVVMDLLR
ncbi:MAG: hypothetical protein Q8O52_23475 [Sulfuritalea sp.]|nr:hypothetical protein [Sulfuritalea sp.]